MKGFAMVFVPSLTVSVIVYSEAGEDGLNVRVLPAITTKASSARYVSVSPSASKKNSSRFIVSGSDSARTVCASAVGGLLNV